MAAPLVYRTPEDDPGLELGRHLIEQGLERQPDKGAAIWSGSLDGRRVEVAVARQKRTRYVGDIRYSKQLGFMLSIRMDCAVKTRLAFVREGLARQGFVRWLHARFGRQQVRDMPEGLEGFCAVAADADWTRNLLAKPRAAALLPDLLAGTGRQGHKLPGVQLMPGELSYTSPTLEGEAFTLERFKPVLEGLQTLASIAEQLPPPAQPSEQAGLERLLRGDPKKGALILIAIVLGGVLLVSALFIGLLIWVATR
ncbi:hypothetical protein [Pseudomarimonas salicorniae]|uniref:Uncharacterized protein n=1 Tax=Pseudomarimonas salicorniae TaxID=2933270 RepID=A0ABT0GGL5_9GAMM|nr:hypothetical protein [Lysobacter sp. CAU 1642]MCK7593492.1 hypothetical protein [Lysobacter sp. CAU 1642]